ncbi:NAD(P)+ transhydrogenase beta chain [Rhizobium sp. BK377]|uniref:NAD(P)+ transhydrogenase beta chain n=1 Tax=Rhizobium sp. BK377 TaxID=2587058 RepID=UPI00160C2804|nr:NAD(P)+ transhydrogenase beta chain [Rhizobium sp. BK377]MBB3461999.1 membrane protein YdbS with pleckstrin-like domain [Rhizobium sp. BK377]
MRREAPGKPSYTMTRRWNWISFVLSWFILVGIAIAAMRGSQEAVAIAPVFVPALCAMIAVLIGTHRHYGSRDFEVANSPYGPPRPYDARDQPGSDVGEVR